MSLTKRQGHTSLCQTQIKPNWARKTRTSIQKFIQWLRKGQKSSLLKLPHFQSSRGVEVTSKSPVVCSVSRVSVKRTVNVTFWIVVHTLIPQLKPKLSIFFHRIYYIRQNIYLLSFYFYVQFFSFIQNYNQTSQIVWKINGYSQYTVISGHILHSRGAALVKTTTSLHVVSYLTINIK